MPEPERPTMATYVFLAMTRLTLLIRSVPFGNAKVTSANAMRSERRGSSTVRLRIAERLATRSEEVDSVSGRSAQLRADVGGGREDLVSEDCHVALDRQH